MRRFLSVIAVTMLAAGCMQMRAPPEASAPVSQERAQEFFLVFFRPASAQLTEAAGDIVREVARNVQIMRAARVEISVPADAPGRTLTEERFTAIQNILSASGVAPGLLQRVSLSAMAMQLPGGEDRAEIRLIPPAGR
jgi:type IV pilus biogenesis protein CpaD/CtpE